MGFKNKNIQMKIAKLIHSRSQSFLVILSILVLIQICSSTKPLISKQGQLLESLKSIDRQIQLLKSQISLQHSRQQETLPNYNQINWTVSQKLQQGLGALYQNLPQFNLRYMKQAPQQSVIATHKCHISHNHNQPISPHSQIKHNYITSYGEVFVLVSHLTENKLQIYSMECQLLTRINQLVVKFLFDQEKATTYNSNANKDATETHLIYLISGKNQLVVIDLSEVKKAKHNLVWENNQPDNIQASTQNKIYRILNNKLILPGQNTQIIGVILKTLNHQSTRSKQTRSSSSTYRQRSLFVAFDSSQIKVFDQLGTLKITMKQPSIVNDLYFQAYPSANTLLEVNDKAIQFVDIHPQPILVEQNWVYFVDTSKYSRQPWGCPYIGNIRKIFVQNYHDTEVYVLTNDRIFKINVKSKDGKDNTKKGLCEVEKSISFYDPFINLKQIFSYFHRKTDEISFFVHKNLIFLDNLVYNLTSQTYLTVQSVQTLLGKAQDKNSQCQQFTIQPFPHIPPTSKKTPLEKYITVILNCQKIKTNEIHIFSVTQIKSESSLLVYIIVGFMLVIFFAVKCFKSTNASLQKEMLYPMNFDAEEKQARKEQYQQMNRYMKQAQAMEEQQKKTKLNQKEEKKKNGQKKEQSRNPVPKSSSKQKKQ